MSFLYRHAQVPRSIGTLTCLGPMRPPAGYRSRHLTYGQD